MFHNSLETPMIMDFYLFIWNFVVISLFFSGPPFQCFTFFHNKKITSLQSEDDVSFISLQIQQVTTTRVNDIQFELRTTVDSSLLLTLQADSSSAAVFLFISSGDLYLSSRASSSSTYRVPHWSKVNKGSETFIEFRPNVVGEQKTISVYINETQYTSNVPWIENTKTIFLGTPNEASLSVPDHVSEDKFKGCVSNVTIGFEEKSSVIIDSWTFNELDDVYVLQINVENDTCAFDQVCSGMDSDPCGNGAVCVDVFDSYECNGCPSDYTGKNCDSISLCHFSAPGRQKCKGQFECVDIQDNFECVGFVTFSEDAYIYIEPEDLTGTLDSISFSIRTRQAHGVVLYIKGPSCFLSLEMSPEGCFVMRSSSIVGIVELMCSIADGNINNVSIQFSPDSIEIRIEDSSGGFYETQYNGTSFDVSCASRVLIGGAQGDDFNHLDDFASGDPKSLTGCLETVRINSLLLPFEASSNNGNGFKFVNASNFVWLNGCTDLNPCNELDSSQTCNSGTCTALTGVWRGFSCNCDNTGFEGDFCEEELDECILLNDPCDRGDCVDLTNDYSCTCQEGFEGKNCSEDIDECSICDSSQVESCNGLCENSATCNNSIGSFSCECTQFWTGQTCNSGSKCDQVLCSAQSDRCSDLEAAKVDGRQFECSCRRGFRGALCELFDNCADEDCNGRGQCSNTEDDSFVCACDTGWEGLRCEKDVDECLLVPCAAGNTDEDCENLPGSYNCHCSFGYALPNCGEVRDFCEDQPCLNDASCTSEDFVGFTCSCIPGFEGTRCETNIDECVNNDCASGSECIDGINNYTCDCSQTGFTGTFCNEACFNSTACQNGGSCIFDQSTNAFFCQCTEGFKGDICDVNSGAQGSEGSSVSTAGAIGLVFSILLVVLLTLVIAFLTTKHCNKTRVFSGSYQPKTAEAIDNSTMPKISDFPDFHIPRAKLERLI